MTLRLTAHNGRGWRPISSFQEGRRRVLCTFHETAHNGRGWRPISSFQEGRRRVLCALLPFFIGGLQRGFNGFAPVRNRRAAIQ
jgi:hypothetical protein